MSAKKFNMKETLWHRLCRDLERQLESVSWALSVCQGCKLERKEWLDLHFARNKTREAILSPPRLQNSGLIFDM